MSLLVIDIACMADGKLATVFFIAIFGGEAGWSIVCVGKIKPMALSSFNSTGVPKLLDLFHFIPMWAPNRSGYNHQQLRFLDGIRANEHGIFMHFSHRLIPPKIKRIVVLLPSGKLFLMVMFHSYVKLPEGKHQTQAFHITSAVLPNFANTRLLDAFHRRRSAMKRIMLCLGCPAMGAAMESLIEVVERNIENVENTGHWTRRQWYYP